MFDESAARRYCETIAPLLSRRVIYAGGRPYLERYVAAGDAHTEPGARGAIYLHHFVASDPAGAVHSHPWAWGLSLILSGGYREHRCTQAGQLVTRLYRPGEVNVFVSDDKHWVELLEADCWTLFLAGEFQKAWGFSPGC